MTTTGRQDQAARPAIPERPTPDGLEAKWAARWEEAGVYRFDRRASREQVYAIDTPPPTVSGALHVGHCFSYTHTDVLARFQRMRGHAVFYPMGWDDNGLPTERLVERRYGVRCDPTLPYDPGFTPPARPGREPVRVSRPNFVALCHQLTAEDERAFEALWRRLGLSVDWTRTYATIGERARRVAQRGFLRALARGEAYQAQAPTLWDPTFATAVAQAELEDREVDGIACRLRFEDLEVETTRPELLAACVALVAHPGDGRHAGRVGTRVRTPLFGVEVPVLAHELAEPGKGTGLAMICTFGDVTDVTWWRELRLPVRAVVTREGRLAADPPPGVPAEGAWRELAGLPLARARDRTIELLRAAGALAGEPRPVRRAVKFYERGELPLEIVTSRQWFLRLLDRRERLLEYGRRLAWTPPFMRARYEDWVRGLTGDWLVSRQRFFGVPFPLWYPLTAEGRPDHEHPLVPGEQRLPVDPTTDVPDGFEPAARDRPGGFTADPDVMDTWATSSLSPQIAGGWVDDPDLYERVFPFDLRPQSHEIIRTWLFYTVVRADAEHGRLPWRRAAISGWVVDPERRKLSKSKARGDEVTPTALLERYGSDAVRYWAASGRPGTDTAFDEARMRVGRRLAIKLLNASRFVLGRLDGGEPGAATEPLDLAMLAGLDRVVAETTAALEGADWARALERTEAFFWAFCDDYLELVKDRAYGAGGGEAGRRSAHAALATALSVQLRLLAPVLPFVTEEVWSWWRTGTVHRAPWPAAPVAPGLEAADPLVLETASAVLAEVRAAKSAARRPLRTPVARLVVRDTPERLAALGRAGGDLLAAARAVALERAPAGAPATEVTLAPEA
ncbi:MAG TPA: valine--tRNA ligase [Actinomycetes bacterium]|nr:valine--tRNA ligase [Actinomycetes bacterium]